MSKKKEEKKELTEEELKAIEKQKHLKFAQSSISSTNVGEVSSSRNGLSYDNISSALQDPYSNVATLQQISKILYYSNGVYYRLIEEFANIPMYDLYLSPTFILGFNKNNGQVEKMNKEYEVIEQQIEKINYKYNFKWFGRMLLLYGELFLYKVEDNNGIFYKMIPNDICRVSGIMENNIYKYSIDLSKLSDENLLMTMPLPIQKLYEKYDKGALDKDEKLVDNFYHLDDAEAVAFLFDDGNTRTKGVPPFCYLFDKIFRIDEIEDEDLESSATDALKIVHQKAPTNEEGELLMDVDILGKYHQATKRNLPKSVVITTNPLPMEVFTLQRQASATLTSTQRAYEYVYSSAGVNSELFNGSKSSSEAVVNSIKTDEMVVDRLNLIFGNFINYEVKNKKKNAIWKVEMLRNTYFNKKDMQTTMRENAMVGIGKLAYLSSMGYTPLTAMSALFYEAEMQLEQYFRPLASGYNSASEDVGRTSNENNNDTELNAPQAENATKPQ
jgi:hypothetical protein